MRHAPTTPYPLPASKGHLDQQKQLLNGLLRMMGPVNVGLVFQDGDAVPGRRANCSGR